MRIKTTKKKYTWTVLRREGDRWRAIVDGMGVITMPTRTLARSVSKELGNLQRYKGRKFRVAKIVLPC
jgi:hypothetical protein